MTDANRTPIKQWTVKQAILLAVVCLIVGIAGGWQIRASQGPAATGSAKASGVATPAANGTTPASRMPGPDRLKERADAQAAPLLDRLKSDPDNSELLTSIGNLYYDAQQYPTAVDYYARVLKARPSDPAVRTDMGTAYWYMGNADSAIAEFNKALAVSPNNPDTLFNLGLVKWRSKKDGANAIADWKKLLAANPNYEGKDKVEQMLAEVKQQREIAPGIAAK